MTKIEWDENFLTRYPDQKLMKTEFIWARPNKGRANKNYFKFHKYKILTSLFLDQTKTNKRILTMRLFEVLKTILKTLS